MEGNIPMELEKSVRKCGSTVEKREKPVRTGGQDALISWLYGHAAGRILLRPLISPWFSKAGGWLLHTRLSALAVKPYAQMNQIDLSECKKQTFRSFNDFFTRELKASARPVNPKPEVWISPCDSRLIVSPISREGRFVIKGTPYTVESLLKNRGLAERYVGGRLWLHRLCVNDYHRYIYPADGVKSSNILIPGVFHTVNPIAGEAEPIYKKNTREYCLIRTKTFGTILMMEVGAMLVGKIENRNRSQGVVHRGQEKGNFAFGGSTVLLLSQPGCVEPFEAIARNSAAGIETQVRMGEAVGSVDTNVLGGQ